MTDNTNTTISDREMVVLASLISPETATAAQNAIKAAEFEPGEMFMTSYIREGYYILKKHGAAIFRGQLFGRPLSELATPDIGEHLKRLVEACRLYGLMPPTRLGEFPSPTPDEKNPGALLRDHFLRKGAGLVIVAPSGVGKSTFATGAFSHWAAGRDFCGIRPARPLKIGVFQTEDDAEEMGEFRDDLLRQLETEGFSMEEAAQAMSVCYEHVPPKSGAEFCEHLKAVQEKRRYDVIVLNPLWAFVGCDMTKNADLGAFLRHGIDPLLKHPDLGCGMVVIHHTNKLRVDNRGRIDLGTTDAYAGAGGAELTNWARAVLVLQEIGQATPREFFLVAAKRGTRLGWTDTEGKPTTRRKISHAERGIFWIDGGGIAATNAVGKPDDGHKGDEYGDPEKDAGRLYDACHEKPMTRTEVRDYARKAYGKNRGDRAYAEWAHSYTRHGLVEIIKNCETAKVGRPESGAE